MKMKRLNLFVLFIIVTLFFALTSCKNESEQYELNPDLFPPTEEDSDSSVEEENNPHISGTFMNVDSDSEGITVHLNYPKNSYPYFKLFINGNSRNKIYYSQNSSQEQNNNDIVFVPVSQNNLYSVTLLLYTTEEHFKKNLLDYIEDIGPIKAVGGTGEYTFTASSTNQKATYNNTTKNLTFNTITSSNSLYDSEQTFDLYVYTLTPMPPVNGQENLTQLNIIDKFSNLIPNATDNTYDVSLVLENYCEAHNLQSLQFGLVEKLQFRKAGETDYLYEVIYYDTVFSRHEPYTYTKIQQAP